MTIDLLFSRSRQTTSPIHLVFGDTSDVPRADVSLVADFGAQLQFVAQVAQVFPALSDLLFRQAPLVAPPVDLLFETLH